MNDPRFIFLTKEYIFIHTLQVLKLYNFFLLRNIWQYQLQHSYLVLQHSLSYQNNTKYISISPSIHSLVTALPCIMPLLRIQKNVVYIVFVVMLKCMCQMFVLFSVRVQQIYLNKASVVAGPSFTEYPVLWRMR